MIRVGIVLIVASLGWFTQAGAGASIDSLLGIGAEGFSGFSTYAGGVWGIALAFLLLGAGLLLCLWGDRPSARVEPVSAPRPSRLRSSQGRRRPSERLEPVKV